MPSVRGDGDGQGAPPEGDVPGQVMLASAPALPHRLPQDLRATLGRGGAVFKGCEGRRVVLEITGVIVLLKNATVLGINIQWWEGTGFCFLAPECVVCKQRTHHIPALPLGVESSRSLVTCCVWSAREQHGLLTEPLLELVDTFSPEPFTSTFLAVCPF